MKCKNCKNKLKNNETFCGKCGSEVIKTTKNSKSKKIIALVCCFAIILSGTIGGLFFYNKKSKSTLDIDGNYNCFTEGFTDVLVTDEKSAIEAVASVGDALGVKDAEKELKVTSVNQIGQDKFYRIQQYYNDIPVYGKSVVVSADDAGKVLGLTANTQNYKETKTEVVRDATEYISIAENHIKKDNVLYSGSGEKVYVSQANGEIGLCYPVEVVYSYNNEVFSKIIFVSSVDLSIVKEIELIDNNISVSGIMGNKNNFDFIQLSGEKDGNEYLLKDDERKILCSYASSGDDTVTENMATTSDAEFVDAYTNMQTIYDYFNRVLNINSFDNNGSGILLFISKNGFLCDQSKSSLVRTAETATRLGSDEFLNYAAIIIGEPDQTFKSSMANAIDVIAHEYTHRLIDNIVLLENGGIDEGICDVFGNLAESDNDSHVNIWQLGENTGYSKYDMSENITMSSYDVNDGGHNNAAIIAHSAYLMWNGIDGNENRKINSETLLNLWYNSLQFLQSDADFSQCRNAVELSARIMLKNKQLTEEQYNTVKTAFDRVGIENATFTYNETVKNKFDLSVLSGEGTENVNFKLEVIKMPEIKVGPGLVNNEMPKLIMEKSVLSGQQSLELEDGTYVLRITDLDEKQNNNQPINIKIIVKGDSNNTTDKVVVHTDFTDIITVELDNTEPTENTTTTIPNETTNVDIPEAEAIAAFERMLKGSDAIWGWNIYEGYDNHQFASMSNSEIIEKWIACDGVPLGVYEVFSPDGTNGIKYTDEPSEENSYSDPKAKFWCSYELDADLVDWILKNVFGKEPDRSIASDKMYYSGNKVYVHSELSGGPGYIYKISDYEKLSDGKYYIYVEATYEANVGVPDIYLKFTATPKQDSDKGIYWRVHSYEEYDDKITTSTTENTFDKNSLIAKYGLSSQKQFVSCENAEAKNYPDDVFGIISTLEVDLNKDTVNELLVVRVAKAEDGSKGKILAEVYQNNNGNLVLGVSQPIYDISFSSAANIYLFYSDVLSEYCIIAESSSSGSYTGVSSWLAEIYTISEKSIELYEKLERVPTVGIFADFETEFKKINVPFAKYCTEFENKDSNSNYYLLCEVEHEIFGDSGSYMTRNHKLKIIDTTT